MARPKRTPSRQRRNTSRAMSRRRRHPRPLVVEELECRVLLAAPVIVTVDPAPNSHTAPAATDVEATFDQPMNAGTVNDGTFVVHGMQSGQLLDPPNVFNVSGSTVRVNPSAPFKPGELVQATATTGLRNQSGEAAAAPFVWQFRVAPTGGDGFFGDSGQELGDATSASVALGDLDGDGDIDAFIGNGEGNRVWLNDGQGIFSDSGQQLGDQPSPGLSLGDLDGDGDLDAFVANNGPNRVWLNDGQGNFTTGQILNSSGSSSAVALGDLDGDGDLDAFVAESFDLGNTVWLNQGDGNFVDSGQSLGNTSSASVALGDLDGDGDLDAFVGNAGADRIWINDGKGNFNDNGQTLAIRNTTDVALGDLDGDGDLDAFVANRVLQPNQVFFNDGQGFFTDSGQQIGDSNSESVALGDLDADGDLDAFVAATGLGPTSPIPGPSKVWLNDGSGVFTDSGQNLGNSVSFGVDLGDLDGDGDLDAFVANSSPNTVWLNRPPTIVSVDPPANSNTASPDTDITVVFDQDLDGATVTDQNLVVHAMQTGQLLSPPNLFTEIDGVVTLDPAQPFKPGELVQGTVTTGIENLGGFGAAAPFVWQFRVGTAGGSGFFNNSGQDLGNTDTEAVALGDLDGDGDLDAFVGNAMFVGQANEVWLNDGNGTFTDSGQRLGSSRTTTVSLGDLDGDGDLDAFVANSNSQPNKVWLNNGNGIFTDSGQNLGSSNSDAVALGDLDGDGDLDAFVGNTPIQSNRVWINNGTGSFTDSGQGLGTSNTLDVALGDLDDDGDLDAFVANSGVSGQANRIWFNDGQGNFSVGPQVLGSNPSNAVELGDLDGDGDLDAFVANINSQSNVVWLNSGGGTFFNSGQTLGNASSVSVGLGDLDGDGDLDAFVGNSPNEANRVWRNDGLGGFHETGESLGDSSSFAVALGDLDGDGDLDSFVGNAAVSGAPNQVWLNQDGIPAGLDSIGLHAFANGVFFLKEMNTSGVADTLTRFGPSGADWVPLAGNWDGVYTDTIGLFDPVGRKFFLKNDISPGPADLAFRFGPLGVNWTPITGDWDGDGVDTIGFYDADQGRLLLRNSNTPGPADLMYRFGPAGLGWKPVAGDWDGDGVDTVGLFDGTRGIFFLRNEHLPGPADVQVNFEGAGVESMPLAGDWNLSHSDSIGFYESDSGAFSLKNRNTDGPADLEVRFGPRNVDWTPLAGNWSGLRTEPTNVPVEDTGQNIATYNLTVENFWSQNHHETWAQSFTDVLLPHFSHLGGATHNSDLTIWEPGGFSSPGFIIMQEEGWIDKPGVGGDFLAEFEVHQANDDAEFFINYPHHFAAGSTIIKSFDISESHPLVTLFSMLGPTPDWFIGVNGLDLRDPGGSGGSTDGWLNTVVVDLFTYDGGSRTEDENFALFGALEIPQKAIALITDTPVDTNPDRTALNSMQIGRFTFELQSVMASSTSLVSSQVSPDLEQPAATLVNPFALRSFNDETVLEGLDSPLVGATPVRAPDTRLSGGDSSATQTSAPANASTSPALLDVGIESDTQGSSQEVVDLALIELLDEGPSDGLL